MWLSSFCDWSNLELSLYEYRLSSHTRLEAFASRQGLTNNLLSWHCQAWLWWAPAPWGRNERGRWHVLSSALLVALAENCQHKQEQKGAWFFLVHESLLYGEPPQSNKGSPACDVDVSILCVNRDWHCTHKCKVQQDSDGNFTTLLAQFWWSRGSIHKLDITLYNTASPKASHCLLACIRTAGIHMLKDMRFPNKLRGFETSSRHVARGIPKYRHETTNTVCIDLM